MGYKVIREDYNRMEKLFESEDYEEALNQAVRSANYSTSSEFQNEIRTALEERGYYMCGWSSTKISIEED